MLGSHVLTAVTKHSTGLRIVRTDVSEEHIAFILRIEVYVKKPAEAGNKMSAYC
jgi:hypothetical protein